MSLTGNLVDLIILMGLKDLPPFFLLLVLVLQLLGFITFLNFCAVNAKYLGACWRLILV